MRLKYRIHIILIDVGKVFDKVQHVFMIKVLKKVESNRECINGEGGGKWEEGRR